MKIVIITHLDFGKNPGGVANRVLGLAEVLSKYAVVVVLHRGCDMAKGSVKLVGYRSPPFLRGSHWISDAICSYAGYLSWDFYSVLKKAVSETEIVQVEQPYLLMPILMVAKTLDRSPLVVLDEHNVEFTSIKSKINSVSFNSFLTSATLPYVFLSEGLAVKSADVVLCVSGADRKLLTKIYGVKRNKLVVIPNGVNLSKFKKAALINTPFSKHNRIVFFHGTLSWYPNLEAANIIADYLSTKLPDVTFLIAGSNPTSSLIKKISRAKNVKYLGFLDNLEGWIKSSDVCIAPILRGGGTKLKVLEYAAAGKPIVATFKAVAGLGMVNGIHGLFYKDVDEKFVDGIKRLLRDDLLARKLGESAFQLAKKYDWSVIGKKLYNTYKSLVWHKK